MTDGSIWYARRDDGAIAHVKPDGTETAHKPAGAKPHELSGLVVGPDGGLWYSTHSGRIGRVPGKLPARSYQATQEGSYVAGLVSGPDKALWFVNGFGASVGRITLDGQVKIFKGPSLGNREFMPDDMAVGRDGRLWITSVTHNAVYRMTPAGAFERFDMPLPEARPEYIAAAPDGSLWFTMRDANRLGRITSEGAITHVDVGPQRPTGIAVADDGTVWFTLGGRDMAGRITPQGQVEKFPCGIAASTIRIGPDGVPRALGKEQLLAFKAAGATPKAAGAPAPDVASTKQGVRNVADDELDRLIATTRGLLVVHVSSDDATCNYCIRANPVFDQLAAANAGRASFVRVSRTPWRRALEVPAIAKLSPPGAPHTIVYRDGKVLREIMGALPLERLQREALDLP